jgi:hypothetical protein
MWISGGSRSCQEIARFKPRACCCRMTRLAWWWTTPWNAKTPGCRRCGPRSTPSLPGGPVTRQVSGAQGDAIMVHHGKHKCVMTCHVLLHALYHTTPYTCDRCLVRCSRGRGERTVIGIMGITMGWGDRPDPRYEETRHLEADSSCAGQLAKVLGRHAGLEHRVLSCVQCSGTMYAAKYRPSALRGLAVAMVMCSLGCNACSCYGDKVFVLQFLLLA